MSVARFIADQRAMHGVVDDTTTNAALSGLLFAQHLQAPRRPPPPPAHLRQRNPTPDDSATDPHAANAILVASKDSTPSSTGSPSSILESFS